MKNTLDDAAVYRQYDTAAMIDHLHRMPQLCRQAWQQAAQFDLPRAYARANKVVILGMGGSAIGGDLVRSLTAEESRMPILIHRDFNLPAFVDDQTLVIASSNSGLTSETLTAYQQALQRKAKTLVITGGGKLLALALENSVPAFVFKYEAPPRAALPFSILPILYIMQKLGIIGDKNDDVAAMVATLESLDTTINETVATAQNPAKQLAEKIYGKLAVIYGGGILSEVAHRWKTQFNENSKTWAFHETYPELNHNAVVGYQFPAEFARRTMVVLLEYDSERLQQGYNVVCRLLQRAGVSYEMVNARGDNPLGQMMSLVLYGDYVSYYLALLYHTDPTPVTAIDFLKRELTNKDSSAPQD